MEEISLDLIEELERQPQKRGRKTKNLERDHRTWFYDIPQHIGECDNPDCKDPRNKKHVMVWMNPDGIYMCRYCWLAGWLVPDGEG